MGAQGTVGPAYDDPGLAVVDADARSRCWSRSADGRRTTSGQWSTPASSASQASVARFHRRTPYGPSRWAQSRRWRSSATSAASVVAALRPRPARRGPRRAPGRARAAPARRRRRARRRGLRPGAGRVRRRRRRCGPRGRASRSRRRSGGASRARRPGESARPAYPRTRSPSTAPAPTEVSWSGSPTSTSRASARVASSRRAIIVSSTIDDSSTTIRSYLSRLARSWRKRVALSGRQPSSRWSVTASVRFSRARSRVGEAAVGGLGQHGLLQPGGGLAGRRGQGDRQPAPLRLRLVGEHADQPGDGGGLAGAGTAGEHGGPGAGGPHRGCALLGVVAGLGIGRVGLGEGTVEGCGQHVVVHRRRGPGRALGQVGAHRDLEPVVAVEVEEPVVEDERALGHHPRARRRRRARRSARARAARARSPRSGRGRGIPSPRLTARTVSATASTTATSSSSASAEIRRAIWSWPAVSTPASLYAASRRVGHLREAPVIGVDGFEELGHRRRPPARRAGRTARSTRAAGGFQEKTPHGRSSTRGVSGPHIPRR